MSDLDAIWVPLVDEPIGSIVEQVQADDPAIERLVAIGLVAGLFSALFGVGGGIVVVPLLILTAGFLERPATATSLGAIGLTALGGTIVYAVLGHVEPGYAALVGLPAAAGALAGTAWQQRVRTSTLTYGFAVVLCVVGTWLLAT